LTVKPIALMRWLVRLVTPPGGVCLDPFAGSGTTGIAARLEGMQFIGIEREEEYVRIAEARIRWWEQHPEGMELVKGLEADRERRRVAGTGQLGLEIG
jgi:DNA modification methylase